MATAATAAATARPKESTFLWEGKDKAGKVIRGEMRAGGTAVVNATLRRQGILVTKVKKQRLRGGGRVTREGHRALHPAARHHDEGGRAAAAVVRHRQQGRVEARRGEAAQRHPHRRGDGLAARYRVPQVSALLRCAVLQPGAGRRAGGDSGKPARPPRDLQGEDPRHQVEDQVGAVLPDRDHRRGLHHHRGDHDFRDPGVQGGVHAASAPICRRPR